MEVSDGMQYIQRRMAAGDNEHLSFLLKISRCVPKASENLRVGP